MLALHPSLTRVQIHSIPPGPNLCFIYRMKSKQVAMCNCALHSLNNCMSGPVSNLIHPLRNILF